MSKRLALGLLPVPGLGWSAQAIQQVAREAEVAGFDAIFTMVVKGSSPLSVTKVLETR